VDRMIETFVARPLLILRLLVRELLPCPASPLAFIAKSIHCQLGDLRGKFSQLVSYHVLGDADIGVVLAIVNLKDQAHEIGQNGCTSGLRLDRKRSLARLGANDG